MYAYLFVNNYKHSLPITGKNTTALQLKFIEMLKKNLTVMHQANFITLTKYLTALSFTSFQDNVNGERKMSQDLLLVYPPPGL